MVEVDVHALKLEVGITGEANKTSDRHSAQLISISNLLAITVEAVLASNVLPGEESVFFSWSPTIDARDECSTYQKAAPIWLPYITQKKTRLALPSPSFPMSIFSESHLHIGRSGGEPIGKVVVSTEWGFFRGTTT